MRSFLYDIASGRSKGFIPALISVLLSPLSFIYGLLTDFLAIFYGAKAVRLPCKVISVGNITLGGTGKTVAVEYICRLLQDSGHKPAVLSRGYKSGPASMGDEPLMLQKRLKGIPVIAGSDRVKGAFKAVNEFGSDTVVLDDGFQQWRIRKDLDILLVDATQGFGNRRLIPAGVLRERLSAMRRADVIFLTKTDLSAGYPGVRERIFRINPRALFAEAVHEPLGFYPLGKGDELTGPQAIKGERVAVLSGIADPGSFSALVKKAGAEAALEFLFPDHHNYAPGELEDVRHKCLDKGIRKVVTTEKDAARMSAEGWGAGGVEAIVLRIALKITEGEERFRDRLFKLYTF